MPVIALWLLAGCMAPPTTFRPVEYPAEPKPGWVKSGPPGAKLERALPAAAQLEAFAEDNAAVSVIRIAVSPDDFYGSKLFDGFDFTMQPLDASNRAVRRLGHMTATLYRFDPDTLEGEGDALMTWNVPASRLAALWSGKDINRGYHMKLAWDRRPMIEYVRMEVRFETLDGRTFTKIVSAGSIDQPRYRWLQK